MKLLRMLVPTVVALAAWLVALPAQAAVSIVTTLPDLAAIAREVGGPDAEVRALALPTQDPHFVDARPNLALALNKADLLVVDGLDLEIGWLPVLQQGARNPKIQVGAPGFVDCSAHVTVIDAPSAPVSRAQGDVHRGGNPHYLLDPKNGAKCGRAIAERLAAIDSAHASAYRDRASALEKAALAFAASQAARFNALGADKKNVVVYHKSWAYLIGWLGLHESGSVEPKPGIPPDPGHVASLLGQMRASNVRALVQEDYYPQTTTKLLASKTGAALVVVPGGTADGQRYLDHLKDVADRVFAALSR